MQAATKSWSRLGGLLVPLAFAIFPFTFALQVVGGNEIYGILPYLLLAMSAVLVIVTGPRPGAVSLKGRAGLLDLLVAAIVLWSAGHAIAGLALSSSSLAETARVLLIYVTCVWVYVYVSFRSNEKDHQDILVAAALSTLLLGTHWCVETFSKFVMQRTSMYQVLTHDYIMVRNGFTSDQVNSSVLYPEYRAYGLTDKHTTTGASVSLGGFAAIGALSRYRLDWRILTGLAFLLILTVGMATLAWISFLLLVPFAILLSERVSTSGQVLRRGAVYGLIIAVVIVVVGAASGHAMDLIDKIADLLATQLSFVLNVDGSSAQSSWFQIYGKEIAGYGRYLAENPLSVIFGEGFSGYGAHRFERGGDVAIFEFLATYGWLLGALLLAGMIGSIAVAVKSLLQHRSESYATGLLMVSAVGLAFLLISLGHYNTFFNKSIYVFLFLFFGFVRRYALTVPGHGHGPEVDTGTGRPALG